MNTNPKLYTLLARGITMKQTVMQSRFGHLYRLTQVTDRNSANPDLALHTHAHAHTTVSMTSGSSELVSF